MYVHCNGRKGRSAVCVICYLNVTHGWSPEFAYQHVRERRKIADLRSLCGIRCQWQAVRKFCQNRETPQVTMPFSKVRVVPDGPVLPEGQKDISNRAKSPSGVNTAVPWPIPSLVTLHPAEVAVGAEHVHDSPCAESGMSCLAEKSVVEAPLTEEHSDKAVDASPVDEPPSQLCQLTSSHRVSETPELVPHECLQRQLQVELVAPPSKLLQQTAPPRSGKSISEDHSLNIARLLWALLQHGTL